MLCVALAVIGVVGEGAVVATASAQPSELVFDGEVRVDEAEVAARAHWTRAEQAMRESQWEEAIDAFLRAIDAAGDKLLSAGNEADIPGGEAFVRYLTVRRQGQRRLTDLTRAHDAAAMVYRRRVEAEADRLFQEAEAAPNLVEACRAWERFLGTNAASRRGNEAWRRYGELRLERGDHHLARAAWEQVATLGRTVEISGGAGDETKLAPLPAGRSWWLTFRAAGKLNQIDAYDARLARWVSAEKQGTADERADAEARRVLVSILSGERERAAWELERFRRRFPQAEGELSGRRAPWERLLTEWLAKSGEWPDVPATVDWPCWGASWDRTARATAGLDPPGRLAWSRPLTPATIPDDPRDATARATGEPAPLLSSHPIVAGPYVVVQDGEGIHAWHRETGAPAFGDDASGLLYAAPLQAAWLTPNNARVSGVPRFPLAHQGSWTWARVGAPWLSTERPVGSDLHPSRLVALDLAAEGRARVVWSLDPAHFGEDWTWEGPPVVADGFAYVGLRRCDAVQSQAHVACFDLSSGQLRWRRFIAAASSPRTRRSLEWTQQLLTFHEGRLFYHARVGVVACLNPEDGEIEWLTRYPRVAADAVPLGGERFRQRDLSPCVARHDLLVVAAADQPRVFALEASTGRLVWIARGSGAETATQILGVASGHVILAGDGLTWIDEGTGEERCRFPAVPSGDGSSRGYGRGILAGDEIGWPVRDAVLVFRVAPERTAQGWQPRAVRRVDLRSRGATGGNLVAAGGMLFIAGADRLYAFGP